MWRIFLLVCLLGLPGCGPEPIVYPDSKPEPQPGPLDPDPEPRPDPIPQGKVILMGFAAPWCGPCKQLIPQIQQALDRLSAAQRERIDWQLWVTTGAHPSSLPDQSTTRQYRDYLGLDSGAFMDPYWRQQQAIIGGARSIPAGAVLYPDGQVFVRHAAGRLNPQQLVQRAVELIGLINAQTQ